MPAACLSPLTSATLTRMRFGMAVREDRGSKIEDRDRPQNAATSGVAATPASPPRQTRRARGGDAGVAATWVTGAVTRSNVVGSFVEAPHDPHPTCDPARV